MSLKEKITLASKYHKVFQGLVAILANHLSGIEINKDFSPRSIFKCEGGVVVNNREIVIGYNEYDDKIFCYDDMSYQRRLEADATESSVTNLIEKINWSNDETIRDQIELLVIVDYEIKLTPDELQIILSKFVSNSYGDPLRNLFIYN